MNIFQSIRNILVPVHPEGYPFIIVLFIISLALGVFWGPFFWIGLLFTVWCIFFFRDPIRVIPIRKDLITSPADGKISTIQLILAPSWMEQAKETKVMRISIFMSMFSCHINRIPIDGIIRNIIYSPGKFANAELDKASKLNERNNLLLQTAYGLVGVTQIAGLVARRIVCWIKKNEQVITGERFGLIRFGSRLDLYLPVEAKILVSVGQNALAGETILASFDYNISEPDFKID